MASPLSSGPPFNAFCCPEEPSWGPFGGTGLFDGFHCGGPLELLGVPCKVCLYCFSCMFKKCCVCCRSFVFCVCVGGGSWFLGFVSEFMDLLIYCFRFPVLMFVIRCWFRFLVYCCFLAPWYIGFKVVWFIGSKVSWFRRFLVSELQRFAKFPWYVFWKILIP